jgi:hypothetical protein
MLITIKLILLVLKARVPRMGLNFEWGSSWVQACLIAWSVRGLPGGYLYKK